MGLIRVFAILVSVLFVQGAFAAQSLSIRAPDKVGVQPNRPFIYLVPTVGQGALTYRALGLPTGLTLNSQTGIIEGKTDAVGSHAVRLMASDSSGRTTSKEVEFVVGEKAVALTPIMGWNPWYVWGCNIDDQKVRQAADLLVSTGLAAAGYNYINLDDCWQGTRDQNGEMVPNTRFPDMKALADYVHSKGLRIGIYTSPGDKTCAGYEGTKDHNPETGVSYLEKDVNTYARWEMDFIKYDYCIFPSDAAQKDSYLAKQPEMYRRMTSAIEKSGRTMVHMICQYGEKEVWKWGAAVGGNLWRTNNDLADEWASVVRNGFDNVALSQYAGPGHWNDLDMLMVGKANWPSKLGEYDIPNQPPRPTKLTPDEQKTHMSLWAIMASPLLFSGDLAQVDAATKELLTNPEIISVNQDSLGAPVRTIRDEAGVKILTRRLAYNALAVAVFNVGETELDVQMSFQELGIPESGYGVFVENLWNHNNGVYDENGVRGKVPPHGVAFFKMTPQ
jgi:alpha-galactosidase